jgi:hypothetical protein
MSLSFASISVHGFVNSVGAYVGLGSLVAVALLVILYFAHARETATLRDRLDEAQQRISGLEGRIAQLMQMQGAAQRGRGPVAPAPAPVTPAPVARPAGAPQGSVRRVPNPATAAAGATATAPAQAAAANPRAGGAPPSAPAGVGGPALASATKLIPDAAPAASEDTMFVPPAAANGKNGDQTAVLTAAPQPAAAAAARPAVASPRPAVAPPPRVQIDPEQEAAEAPATAAGGAGRVRRIGGNPQAPVVSLPAFDDESVGGRFSGAMLPLLIAAIAVAVIIAGLIVITNSGGGTTSGNVSHKNNSSVGTTGQTLHNKKPKTVPFSAAKYTVAVLNATAHAGLAGDVGTKLAADGYKKGNITNAATQTQGLTFVYYVGSSANKVAAQHVATALTLPASRVHKAGTSVLQSCTISATGASLGSTCKAQVIVSVGQDRASLATG